MVEYFLKEKHPKKGCFGKTDMFNRDREGNLNQQIQTQLQLRYNCLQQTLLTQY